MRERFDLPRLTKRDIQRILDSHNAVMTVRGALDRSSWSAGRALSASLVLVDMVLCELYNRAEAAYLKTPHTPAEPSSQEEQLEPSHIEVEAAVAYDASREGK